MPDFPGEEHLAFWLRSLDQPQFVYVIQGKPGSPIKVGRAKDPLRRMASLQTGNPDRLHLLYVLPGGAALERKLQSEVRSYRGDGGEEWFETDPAFLRMVKATSARAVSTYTDQGLLPFYPGRPEWDRAVELDRKREAPAPRGIGKMRHRWRTTREAAPMTVRFEKPSPVTPVEQAQRTRDKLGGRPSSTQ